VLSPKTTAWLIPIHSPRAFAVCRKRSARAARNTMRLGTAWKSTQATLCPAITFMLQSVRGHDVVLSDAAYCVRKHFSPVITALAGLAQNNGDEIYYAVPGS